MAAKYQQFTDNNASNIDATINILSGRVFGGIGLGLTLSITPVYLVEISTLQYRGMLGVLPPLLTQV
jgi:hypothetical protein